MPFTSHVQPLEELLEELPEELLEEPDEVFKHLK